MNFRRVTTVLLVLILIMLTTSVVHRLNAPSIAAVKPTYSVIPLGRMTSEEAERLQADLNTMAARGWELSHVHLAFLVFKK